jgi:hypothetical protein
MKPWECVLTKALVYIVIPNSKSFCYFSTSYSGLHMPVGRDGSSPLLVWFVVIICNCDFFTLITNWI